MDRKEIFHYSSQSVFVTDFLLQTAKKEEVMPVRKVPVKFSVEVVPLLVGFGWKIPTIARAIEQPVPTVERLCLNLEIGKHGFRKKEVYRETFEHWVWRVKDSNGPGEVFNQARAAIEVLLEIDKIKTAVRAMEESFTLLCRPRCAPILQPYVDLAVAILGLKFVSGIDEFDVWSEYLDGVDKGSIPAPESANEAIECLADMFSALCVYSAVMPTVSIDLRYLLNGWMSSQEFFTQRQQDVIAHRFALDRIGSKDPAKIGSKLRITREEVLEALNSGMAELRKDWRIGMLVPYFESFSRVHARNLELKKEVERLRADNEALVTTMRDGSAGEELRRVERQKLIMKLHCSVSELDLSVRGEERLVKAGILRIGQLVQCTEGIMTAGNGFSVKALPRIRDSLAACGLSLGMPLEESVIALFLLPPRVQMMLDRRRGVTRLS
ncbi:MAG: DNA-directed RNA polymerase subunit alpha C-terminal domain-containing protein [Patescibacteria group bacterium]